MPNDGVRSSWKGHRPSIRFAPDRRSSVFAPTRSTMSIASRTRSIDSGMYFGTRRNLRRELGRHGELGEHAGGEAVGHAGDVVRDALGEVGAGDAAAVRNPVRMRDVLVEQ